MIIYSKWNGDGGYYAWPSAGFDRGKKDKEKEEEKKEEFLKEEEMKL